MEKHPIDEVCYIETNISGPSCSLANIYPERLVRCYFAHIDNKFHITEIQLLEKETLEKVKAMPMDVEFEDLDETMGFMIISIHKVIYDEMGGDYRKYVNTFIGHFNCRPHHSDYVMSLHHCERVVDDFLYKREQLYFSEIPEMYRDVNGNVNYKQMYADHDEVRKLDFFDKTWKELGRDIYIFGIRTLNKK
jgi:hypothetical protein